MIVRIEMRAMTYITKSKNLSPTSNRG